MQNLPSVPFNGTKILVYIANYIKKFDNLYSEDSTANYLQLSPTNPSLKVRKRSEPFKPFSRHGAQQLF